MPRTGRPRKEKMVRVSIPERLEVEAKLIAAFASKFGGPTKAHLRDKNDVIRIATSIGLRVLSDRGISDMEKHYFDKNLNMNPVDPDADNPPDPSGTPKP